LTQSNYGKDRCARQVLDGKRGNLNKNTHKEKRILALLCQLFRGPKNEQGKEGLCLNSNEKNLFEMKT